MKPTVVVIIGSTRPGRVGAAVGQWMEQVAVDHGGFTVEMADLAQINLPLLDEPNHPRLRRYVHEHTKAWSALIERADAVIAVMPEYNYGFNAALKNAIDYLFHEWAYTPVGLVSYGGVSGGTRGAQMLRQVFSALNTMVSTPAVTIPFVAQSVDENAVFHPSQIVQDSASQMLDELVRLEQALRPLRRAEQSSSST